MSNYYSLFTICSPQNEEDRSQTTFAELWSQPAAYMQFIPHYVAYNSSLRVLYLQHQALILLLTTHYSLSSTHYSPLATIIYYSLLLTTTHYYSLPPTTSLYYSLLLTTILYYSLLLTTTHYHSLLLTTTRHYSLLLTNHPPNTHNPRTFSSKMWTFKTSGSSTR